MPLFLPDNMDAKALMDLVLYPRDRWVSFCSVQGYVAHLAYAESEDPVRQFRGRFQGVFPPKSSNMTYIVWWYGVGRVIGQDLVLDVQFPPAGFRVEDGWILTVTIRLHGAPVVDGPMLIMTESNGSRIKVVSITHDPDDERSGTWRSEVKGPWVGWLKKTRRPSRYLRKEVV